MRYLKQVNSQRKKVERGYLVRREIGNCCLMDRVSVWDDEKF